MKWSSSGSVEGELSAAVREAAAGVRDALGGPPDLVVVFVSEHHRQGYDRIPSLVADVLGEGGMLVGCSAGGVIGGGHEIEQRPGLAVTAAVLPGVEVVPFRLETSDLPEPAAAGGEWERRLGVSASREPKFVLLPDPFTFDCERFLRGLDRAFPRSRKIGGLASGGGEPGANALFLGREVHHSGVVGVALAGDLELDTIVAQGCRPIGQPSFVTRARGNVLNEIDGRPPLRVLEELYRELDARDRELFRNSLFLGLVMDEDRQEYRHGDFLIRNLIGLDRDSGVIAVGAQVREGMVVQFHLRDARTSAEDLEEMLARYPRTGVDRATSGSLLFSCLGRGAHLYGRPDHDTDAFRRHLGQVPLGGFFCNGEIGPVRGATFLHGYTSSFGIFRPRRPLPN